MVALDQRLEQLLLAAERSGVGENEKKEMMNEKKCCRKINNKSKKKKKKKEKKKKKKKRKEKSQQRNKPVGCQELPEVVEVSILRIRQALDKLDQSSTLDERSAGSLLNVKYKYFFFFKKNFIYLKCFYFQENSMKKSSYLGFFFKSDVHVVILLGEDIVPEEKAKFLTHNQ